MGAARRQSKHFCVAGSEDKLVPTNCYRGVDRVDKRVSTGSWDRDAMPLAV